MELINIYKTLLERYGKQGWWSARTKKDKMTFKESRLSCQGKKYYTFLNNKKWEMCTGAILTQNTAWSNVESALDNLIKADVLNIEKMASMPLSKLEKLIKPSGFYKQKAVRLRNFARFVLSHGSVDNFYRKIEREELLKQNGIGPETADSILLYACDKPYFVIDAYTQRIFSRIGIKPNGLTGIHKKDYELWRKLFEQNLPNNIKLYKEYHALIVKHAKHNCRKKSNCDDCIFYKSCKRIDSCA
ncbi:MAG: endonuclease [Candidatus Aenigmarchaeota archaeon]|nr:endonuclease [Candidatus Aenigmarchaeota archaeon]